MAIKRKRGRPRNIKVNIRDLYDYLSNLPENHPTKESLTPDKMTVIKRYILELQFLEKTLEDLKADIAEHGPVELFVQGEQRLRRANPSVQMYNATMRTYRGLINKIGELVKGVDVIW